MKANDLVNSVAAKLRKRIILGEFTADTSLREIPMAQEYSVARGTLRAALQMMESEGLIRSQANGRRTVCPFTQTNIDDVYMMRTLIEIQALRLIRERSVISYTIMASSLDNIAAAPKKTEILIRHDLAFHRSIVEASQSGYLLRCWDMLNPAIETLLTINTDTAYHEAYENEFYQKHKHIFDGIASGTDMEAYLDEHIAVAHDLSVSLLRAHRQNR